MSKKITATHERVDDIPAIIAHLKKMRVAAFLDTPFPPNGHWQGVSLGKTHYLLKALLTKGWVKAQNFQRSDRKLGYLYVLTPQGVRQRMQLTQAFLARKELEYEALQRQIATLREELASHADEQP